MKNIEKLLQGLYNDKEIYPDVEAYLKDKKNLSKLTDDELFTKANDHVNGILTDYNTKPENQSERDARWYWIMWHGLCKLWYWVDKRKPPKEPLPQKHKPLTLESLEYKTNNDWSDPSNWP